MSIAVLRVNKCLRSHRHWNWEKRISAAAYRSSTLHKSKHSRQNLNIHEAAQKILKRARVGEVFHEAWQNQPALIAPPLAVSANVSSGRDVCLTDWKAFGNSPGPNSRMIHLHSRAIAVCDTPLGTLCLTAVLPRCSNRLRILAIYHK
jgi:hypothetical protein